MMPATPHGPGVQDRGPSFGRCRVRVGCRGGGRWIAVLMALGASAGCATSPRMRLTLQTPNRAGQTAWWQSDDPAGVRGPIVGIEHCYESGVTRQVVFSDRGVRIFEYRGQQLIHRSPPVSDPPVRSDATVLRSALRRYSRNPAAGTGMTLPALPETAMANVSSSAEIGVLLEDHWSGIRTPPPPGMTYDRVAVELGDFPHGVTQLTAASEAF